MTFFSHRPSHTELSYHIASPYVTFLKRSVSKAYHKTRNTKTRTFKTRNTDKKYNTGGTAELLWDDQNTTEQQSTRGKAEH